MTIIAGVSLALRNHVKLTKSQSLGSRGEVMTVTLSAPLLPGDLTYAAPKLCWKHVMIQKKAGRQTQDVKPSRRISETTLGREHVLRREGGTAASSPSSQDKIT